MFETDYNTSLSRVESLSEAIKRIFLAVQHHIGPAVHTSSLRFNISKLNMLLANQSDLMAHLIPHTRGDDQGVVPTPVAGWQVCSKNLFAEIQHI